MLTCAEARAALLHADLDALEGRGESALARHLGECTACRRRAERVLAATAALRSERSAPPRKLAREVWDSARAQAAQERRRRRTRWAAVPALAAAGLAAILLTRNGIEPAPSPLLSRTAPLPPLMESAAQRVAVFTTDNPTIVVVWQF